MGARLYRCATFTFRFQDDGPYSASYGYVSVSLDVWDLGEERAYGHHPPLSDLINWTVEE